MRQSGERFWRRFGVRLSMWLSVAGAVLVLAIGGVRAAEPRTLDWEELVPGGYTDEYVANANAVPPEVADHTGAPQDVPADAESADGWTADDSAAEDGRAADDGDSPQDLPDDLSFEEDPNLPNLQMAPQFLDYRVVDALNGQTVKIPGFVVPFDMSVSGDIEEFLLVPYFGACIHVPPPPPNQIIFVTLKEPRAIENIWDPFWVEGVLRTERYDNDLGSAAYTLAADKIAPYDY